MFESQIPLLGVGTAVRIERAVKRRSLAVEKCAVDERRNLKLLRQSVLQEKGRRQAAIRAAE